MLKIAGWIISGSAVDNWRKAHPELNQNYHFLTIPSRLVEILDERKRKGFKPPPFSEEQIIFVSWPKMTNVARGKTECILVRRVDFNAKNETWDNFTPIPQKLPKDQELFDELNKDGLKLGEWVTVPDPFENDWPFEKRHPGACYPPDPSLYDGSLIALPPSRSHNEESFDIPRVSS